MISEKIFRPTSCIYQKYYLGSEKKNTGLAVVIIIYYQSSITACFKTE